MVRLEFYFLERLLYRLLCILFCIMSGYCSLWWLRLITRFRYCLPNPFFVMFPINFLPTEFSSHWWLIHYFIRGCKIVLFQFYHSSLFISWTSIKNFSVSTFLFSGSTVYTEKANKCCFLLFACFQIALVFWNPMKGTKGSFSLNLSL